jgi:hypothetical protein
LYDSFREGSETMAIDVQVAAAVSRLRRLVAAVNRPLAFDQLAKAAEEEMQQERERGGPS